MKLAIKRVEGHGHRYAHVIDSLTSRGLLLHCEYCDVRVGSWDWARVKNVEGVVGQEAILDFLVNNNYIPRDVPDKEFNYLYEKSTSRNVPMFREMGDFEPSEMPAIQEIIEQSNKDYAINLLKELARAKSR